MRMAQQALEERQASQGQRCAFRQVIAAEYTRVQSFSLSDDGLDHIKPRDEAKL